MLLTHGDRGSCTQHAVSKSFTILLSECQYQLSLKRIIIVERGTHTEASCHYWRSSSCGSCLHCRRQDALCLNCLRCRAEITFFSTFRSNMALICSIIETGSSPSSRRLLMCLIIFNQVGLCSWQSLHICCFNLMHRFDSLLEKKFAPTGALTGHRWVCFWCRW